MNDQRIHIGKMDSLIQVVRKVKTQSTTGAQTSSTEVVAEVWAHKETASSDKVLDDKVVALNVVSYQFRYHPALDGESPQELYVQDGSQVLEIYGFEILGRRDYFKLKCQIRE